MTFIKANNILHSTLSIVDMSFYCNKILKNSLPNFLSTAKCSQICLPENPDLASILSKIKAMESYKEADLYKLGQGGRICDLWDWTEPLRPVALDFEVAWLVEVKNQLIVGGQGQSRREKKEYIFLTLNFMKWYNWWGRNYLNLGINGLSHFPWDNFVLAPGPSALSSCTLSYHIAIRHWRLDEQCLRES